MVLVMNLIMLKLLVTEQYASENLTEDELQQKIASHKLEHSFIGITGQP